MNITEYREKTKRTLPNLGFDKETQLIPIVSIEIADKLNLSHMALGLAGEIGELVNCIGTELKNTIDKPNLIEELGDLWWYFANYCNMRNRPIPDNVKIVIESDLALDLLLTSIADLVDLVKRFMAYNKEIDTTKELETIYNITAALTMLEELYGISGSEIRERNINKLIVRYPNRFNDIDAIDRNYKEERNTLE